MPNHRAKKNFLIFSAILLAAGVWLLFSPFGWLRMRKIEQKNTRLKEKIERVETENRRMAREADCLAGDKKCFADLARKKFGLIGKNEMIIILPGKGKK